MEKLYSKFKLNRWSFKNISELFQHLLLRQPNNNCSDVLHWSINPPLSIFICIIMSTLKKCWKSVCDKVQRKRTIDEGDESWAGGYFNHRNINSRQEYYHFLNQNIAALLSARGTFSEKIFFDLDWITLERCDDWDDCDDDYIKVNVCPLQKNGVLLTILPTFMFLCHSHDSHTLRKSFLFEFKQAALSIMV